MWKKDRLNRLKRKLAYYEYRGWTDHIEFVVPFVARLEREVMDMETKEI